MIGPCVRPATIIYVSVLLIIACLFKAGSSYVLVPNPEYISCPENSTDYDNCTDTGAIDEENQYLKQTHYAKMWMLEFSFVMVMLWLVAFTSGCYIYMKNKRCARRGWCFFRIVDKEDSDETSIGSADYEIPMGPQDMSFMMRQNRTRFSRAVSASRIIDTLFP
jgi:hypothetical protein